LQHCLGGSGEKLLPQDIDLFSSELERRKRCFYNHNEHYRDYSDLSQLGKFVTKICLYLVDAVSSLVAIDCKMIYGESMSLLRFTKSLNDSPVYAFLV
jgi:hypothetical protein